MGYNSVNDDIVEWTICCVDDAVDEEFVWMVVLRWGVASVVEYAYNVEAIFTYECIRGEVLIVFHGK